MQNMELLEASPQVNIDGGEFYLHVSHFNWTIMMHFMME